MGRRAVLFGASVAFASVLTAPTAHAGGPQTSNEKVPVYDCRGRATPCTNSGPSVVDDGDVVGFVNYRTTNTGDLRVVLSVKDVAPSATMQVDLGCDDWNGAHKRPIGSIATDEDGNGTAQITVPAEVLTSTCGAGEHDGHLDVYDAGRLNDTYVAALEVQFSS